MLMPPLICSIQNKTGCSLQKWTTTTEVEYNIYIILPKNRYDLKIRDANIQYLPFGRIKGRLNSGMRSDLPQNL